MAKMAQGLSPAALEVSRLAESERVRLGHPYLGDEHLLLGVLAHASNGAAAMLTERGLDLTTARAGIARLAEEAGPIARDDAAVLREFGIDVAQMRRQLESTFGVLAVRVRPPRAPRDGPARRARRGAAPGTPAARRAPHRPTSAERGSARRPHDLSLHRGRGL